MQWNVGRSVFCCCDGVHNRVVPMATRRSRGQNSRGAHTNLVSARLSIDGQLYFRSIGGAYVCCTQQFPRLLVGNLHQHSVVFESFSSSDVSTFCYSRATVATRVQGHAFSHRYASRSCRPQATSLRRAQAMGSTRNHIVSFVDATVRPFLVSCWDTRLTVDH
jgi:hypothetical protein